MRSETVSTKLHQLTEQAKRHPERVFTTLHHLIDVEFLQEAFLRLRRDAAAGVVLHIIPANFSQLKARSVRSDLPV